MTLDLRDKNHDTSCCEFFGIRSISIGDWVRKKLIVTDIPLHVGVNCNENFISSKIWTELIIEIDFSESKNVKLIMQL